MIKESNCFTKLLFQFYRVLPVSVYRVVSSGRNLIFEVDFREKEI